MTPSALIALKDAILLARELAEMQGLTDEAAALGSVYWRVFDRQAAQRDADKKEVE